MVEGFWATMEGVLARLAMLAESLEWGEFNQATIRISTEQLKTIDFQMMGPIRANICPICEMYVGQVYKLGEFPIDLPLHPNCVHWWDVYQPGREAA